MSKVKDEFFIGPRDEDGTAPAVRRDPDGEMSTCLVREVEDGEDLTMLGGDVYHLEPIGRGFYEGDKLVEGRGRGPAKVATDEYRKGWDRIFN
jgi:hypothetical protein